MPYNRTLYQKQYRRDNREKRRLALIKWRLENPEAHRKSSRLQNWKQAGIIDEDLVAVYDYFITQTHCWICDTKYTESNFRCLDHDHDTGEIRYICCRYCNIYVVG